MSGWEAFEAVGNLIGVGMSRSDRRKDRAQRAQELTWARQQFAQIMDESIQRRVADARKAGIHPLFAMGGNPSGSPTITATASEGRSGSSGGEFASRAGSAITDAIIAAKAAEARKSDAEAAEANAKAAHISQRLNSQGRDGVQVTRYPNGRTVLSYADPRNDWDQGIVYGPGEVYNPEVATSQAPGVESGTHPSHRQFRTPDGQTVRIPMQLDEVAQVAYVAQRTPYLLKKWGVKRAFHAVTGRWPTDAEYIKLKKTVKRRQEKAAAEVRSFIRSTSGRPVR
jgi:hypothetical protein